MKEEILVMSKQQYKKKDLVEKAALKYLIAEKESHSKLTEIKYKKLSAQPYLIDRRFSKKGKQIIISVKIQMC